MSSKKRPLKRIRRRPSKMVRRARAAAKLLATPKPFSFEAGKIYNIRLKPPTKPIEQFYHYDLPAVKP